MPIQLVCPSCQFAFSVKDGFQGLTVLCRKCQQKIQVPESGQGLENDIATLPTAKPSAGPTPSWLEQEPDPAPPAPAVGQAAGRGGWAATDEGTSSPLSPLVSRSAPMLHKKTMLTVGVAALLLIGVVATVFFLVPRKDGGSPPPRTVNELCRDLKEGDDAGRRNAAVELGNQGSEAAGAVPNLLTALQDPVAEVRAAAAEARGKIGPKARVTY